MGTRTRMHGMLDGQTRTARRTFRRLTHKLVRASAKRAIRAEVPDCLGTFTWRGLREVRA